MGPRGGAGLDRRRFLLGGAAGLALVSSSGPVLARQGRAVPFARVEPVSDAYFGHTVVDPYRWMEDPADPDWEPYLLANQADARATLDVLPERPELVRRLRELAADINVLSLPWLRGSREFYEITSAAAQMPRIRVREGGADRDLFDVESLVEAGRAAALTWWTPSPDGRFIALGLDIGGREEPTLRILDVERGELLPDRVERCSQLRPAWLPDSSALFYSWLGDGAFGTLDYRANQEVRLHRVGTDPQLDRVILARGIDPAVSIGPHEEIEIYCRWNSGWALACTYLGAARGLWRARLADVVAGRPNWRAIYEPEHGVPDFDLYGDHLWVWGAQEEHDGAPAVFRHDLREEPGAPPVSRAAFTGGAVRLARAVEGGLFVSLDSFAYSQLFFVPDEGETIEVPLPEQGAIMSFGSSDGLGRVDIGLATWLKPGLVWRMSAVGPAEQVDLPYGAAADTTGLSVVTQEVEARDGERIPITLIGRSDTPLDGSAPCLVRAYGAYGTVQSAQFDQLGLALIERGGLMAVAHVRGGGEFGRAWHQAGRQATKHNTWRDLIDCCEHLVRHGWTSPERLAIRGGSAGGIAVGRAMTERPDLFRLVISSVGVLNPLRSETETNGIANVHEFGTVTEPDGFRAIFKMDAYHHVRDGVRYPTVLLTHGINDSRVAVWHSAKMAARLRAAGAADSGQVLFLPQSDTGHLVTSFEPAIADFADVLALLLDLSRT